MHHISGKVEVELLPRFGHRKDNARRIPIGEINHTDIIVSLPAALEERVNTETSNALRRFRKIVKRTMPVKNEQRHAPSAVPNPPSQLVVPSSEQVNLASQWPSQQALKALPAISKYQPMHKLAMMRRTASHTSQDSSNTVHALRFSPNGKHLIACLYAHTLCV